MHLDIILLNQRISIIEMLFTIFEAAPMMAADMAADMMIARPSKPELIITHSENLIQHLLVNV